MRIIIPDMGHGNSIGIFPEESSSLLIDCGTRNYNKKANFVRLIEAPLKKVQNRDLVITHYHFDHYSLLANFPNGFFNRIHLPALPHQNRTSQALLRFLALAIATRFKDYYLTPVISMRGKKICPLVKGDSFHAMCRDWDVLWPDYVILDKRNKRRIDRFLGEIEGVKSKLNEQQLHEFERTYSSISRIFSKTHEDKFDFSFLDRAEAEEMDYEVKEAIESLEKKFRPLANRASLVVRDESTDFLFTGDIDNTILKNHLSFENDYFLIEAPHHGGYYGQAFSNVSTDILVISRKLGYKPRCEYFQQLVWNTLVDTARMGNCTITTQFVKRKNKRIGILAYGSVIDDPRAEIKRATCDVIRGVKTPFKIEFARKSKNRNYAPTLIPVETGGARVKAQILVMKDGVSEKTAKDILYRREKNQVGSSKEYKHPTRPNKNKVIIERLEDFQNVDVVLFVRIGANIDPLTPTHLARLAIESARKAAGAEKEDGINYLARVKRQGIRTPLMKDYENEILRMVDTRNLEDAWRKVRAGE